MNGYNHTSQMPNSVINGKLLSKHVAASANTYILHSAVNSEYSDKFAVTLSNSVVQVYGEGTTLLSTHAHDKDVTDVKFSKKEPSLLFSSSLDGKINVWDIRCNKPVQSFLEDSDGVLKPLTCFDYNLDEQLVCAGTELIREDSFLLFWDRRSSEILGGYWNSHTDEITQVHFHPTVSSDMASSSVDGLINLFDLNGKTEDDALMYTLNVGCGVSTFCWRNSDLLSCTTTVEEFQLWSPTEASPSLSVSRENLGTNCQIKIDYFISSLKIADTWLLATGTYGGMVHLWRLSKDGLKPVYCLSKGHSSVVRTISYNAKENVILTGGEDGFICHWKVKSV